MLHQTLRQKTLRLALTSALALALLPSCALAQQATANDPDAARLRAHVTLLASERLDGRKTGTPGAESAAEYVASEFRKYGLAPGGDSGAGRGDAGRTYLQKFPYVAGVEQGKSNEMTLH
ncbi:MAG TPA: hypothetical protein VFX96_14855, partial [Pyrinomonadaceae bacterium]|nr:hypothetical protein [Pyrinomonadaceae bacterium]